MELEYSVAIRTLGLAGESFIRCLKSIFAQSIKPHKVIIYIAQGYPININRIGYEEYIPVPKGMVAQRALNYDEIDTDYILLLDDDVELAPNSAEILLKQARQHNADCVAADTFKSHEMSTKYKIYNAIVNFAFPRNGLLWAFKINHSGGFSYNNNPSDDYYPSQSAAGPASLWRQSTLRDIRLCDETWLDRLGFAYGDDAVIFYKLYTNGYNLGVSYNCGITHLNACSASNNLRKDKTRFIKRSKSLFIIWHRTIYKPSKTTDKIFACLFFSIKSLITFLAHIIAIIPSRNIMAPVQMLQGLYQGIKFVCSTQYKSIPAFKFER